MEHFERLFPLGRAAWLREQLTAAIGEAYDENCRRFVDEIGDNATTFGISLFHNICFLLEQRLNDASGVIVERPNNSFALEIDGYYLHVYKAPPGTASIHGMRFDQSEVRLQLVKHNTRQLRLEFDDEAAPSELRHVVVVHFGDPVGGLDRIEVGAPIASSLGGFDWQWAEMLSGTPATQHAQAVSLSEPVDWTPAEAPDFGLTVIANDAEGGERHGHGGSAS